jgi:hypothetical protein
MKYTCIILLALALFTFSCSSGKTNDTANGSDTLSTADLLKTETWKCVDTAQDKFCLPPSWKPFAHNKGYIFCSYLDNKDSTTVFAVMKTAESKDVNINAYLKKVYKQLKSDSAEIVQGYSIKKMVYETKETYFGRYYADVNDRSYLTYSMIFELDNNIYEVALKCEKANWKKYSAVFQKILSSFRHKDAPFFREGDRITEQKAVDLSKL